jgi:hypothetical protein
MGESLESYSIKMKFIIALCLSALISCAYSIHNGDVVKPNSIPYQVLLLLKNSEKTSKCGGALVRSNRVLTAGK